MDANLQIESQRIAAEYERREREKPSDYYALHQPFNLYVRQEHERMLLHCLRKTGLVPLTDRRVLEVGSGHGDWLGIFANFGAAQENIAGIELGNHRVEAARRRLPAADIRVGNAAELPWPDASFDVVFQRMVFTSILDPAIRKTVAAEMMRVTRPRGAIVWVDFFINPRNPQVYCLQRPEIHALFPGWRARLYRTTLAPPLARRLVNVSWGLARALESLKILNTFYFGYLQREP